MSKEYQRGYDEAKDSIKKGEDPQELWNQSEGSLDYNDFDRGWQTACLEEGATDPY